MRTLLLFISSASLLSFVCGIPSSLNSTFLQELELTGDNVYPTPSYLLEASQEVPYSLLDPFQLMNSSVDCEAFTNGTSPLEFSSPKYPQHYPNDIDCIKIIQAPEGHVVLVQFHDFFHIEAPADPGSACPYDYLEIRHGKFGYSPIQGKTCGKQPPTLTKSQGKFMWLRFHSDSTVSYKGFRAVIHFIPDTSPKPAFDSCIYEIGGIEGEIVSKDEIGLDYLRYTQQRGDTIDCTWVIQTAPGKKIFLRIPVYSLERPNDCNYNAIEIYTSYAKLAGKTTDLPVKLCGSLQKSTVTSEDHVLAIRLTTRVGAKSLQDEMKKLSQFQANYTIIRPIDVNASASTGKSCAPGEFDCSDNNCINETLVCNGKVNCQLKNDEENCPDLKAEGLKADIFIIAFLGTLLVIGMCTGMFLNIFRKLKQDREELLALRAIQRKSKESGLGSEAQSQKSVCPSETQQNQRPHTLPPSEEQSSTESKDTIIHKPILDSTNVTTGTGSFLPYDQTPGNLEPPVIQLNPRNPLRTVGRRASEGVPKERLQVAVYRKPSEPVQEPIYVPMQFVRDCACQTRESYLMARRHATVRAPLAKVEVIEFFQGTPIRRLSRPQTPTFFPPSSASSEIGNSLERLDEEFE